MLRFLLAFVLALSPALPAFAQSTAINGTIEGTVTDDQGAVLPGVTVTVINAEVPLASMFDYANELRSLTQGKASFSMEFSRYKQVPRSIQEEVVERRRREKKERAAS